MPHVFRLPDIGEGLEDAEIVEWYVAVGDLVDRDQALVEVLTDKASSDLPSPVAGTVLALGAAEGVRLRVGEVLIEIDDGTDSKASETSETLIVSGDSHTIAPRTATARPKAAPATRRLALELGLDLADLNGTGPGGRITADDVHRSATPRPSRSLTPSASTQPIETEDDNEPKVGAGLGQLPVGHHTLRGVRGIVARNMAQAWAEIPHIHTMDELDASLLMDFQARIRTMDRPGATRITPLTIVAVAAARALRRFPVVNGHIEGRPADSIVIPDGIHLGIATATERGLLVPVIRHADTLDLFAMADQIATTTASARSGDLTQADLTGATFTVTNYGSLGGRFATPIIPPGQGAILGIGAIAERPIAVDGEVLARPTLPVVLGADHRLIDGDLAEVFRRAVVDDLTEPLHLLMGG
ncbi:MAG: dihydrolipoamide acetyltransferase family protein [Acidimicrobiales bacterium]|nr:dihydrolipoamide acetyltransferase family protein [Acidimicrobiales bacterium]